MVDTSKDYKWDIEASRWVPSGDGSDESDPLRGDKIREAAPELYEALKDMLSGWRYIRESYGDLYGVGWDRAQQKAESAIKSAEER